jgi:predicted flap endonuclease-1-like 5' DNA nuclease
VPYTLLKFLLWFGLAALIGGVIGWLLRSLKCRAEIADARSANVDVDDVDRMRHRLANLEQVVAERDRLRMQVADLRAADSPGVVGAPVDDVIEPEADEPAEAPADTETARSDSGDADEPADTDADATSSGIMPDPSDTDGDAADEDERPATVAGLVAVPDPIDADADDANDDEADTTDDGVAEDGVEADATEPDATEAETADVDADAARVADAPALDLAAAAAAIGKKIALDDLTVVEGIGPKISELCRGIGIDTWRGLADADTADLRSMLDAAGPRYQIHKPESWPRQAELLATGQWEAFVALTDELDGGR